MALKVPCNANACWILLKYISVSITNSSTVPYKYASYIFEKKKKILIFMDIAKPRLRKILKIIFSGDDIIGQLQRTKLCAFNTIHCQSPQALAHNNIASQVLIQYEL